MYVLAYVRFNTAHYFQLERKILIFFKITLVNPAPPSWKFSSLMINSSMEESSQITPSSRPIPTPTRKRHLGTLQFFGHLKRALELLISIGMSPLATFSDHGVDTITPGKKKHKQINMHP